MFVVFWTIEQVLLSHFLMRVMCKTNLSAVLF